MPIDLDPNTVCYASVAEICFCADAATQIGAIAITTATDDGSFVVDAIHGDPRGIEVGQSLASIHLPANARAGERWFLSILPNPARPDMHTFKEAYRIAGDELVLGCYTAAPSLSTADAIDAALATPSCEAHLAALDDRWEQSHCGDDGLCSIGADGSTLVAVLVVALIVRRRP